MNGQPCFLCTSPVPQFQEDANYAYIAGTADGMLFAARGERRCSLCSMHQAKLDEVLKRYNLSQEGKELPPRMIPANPEILSFVHCRRCFEEKPRGSSLQKWAALASAIPPRY